MFLCRLSCVCATAAVSLIVRFTLIKLSRLASSLYIPTTYGNIIKGRPQMPTSMCVSITARRTLSIPNTARKRSGARDATGSIALMNPLNKIHWSLNLYPKLGIRNSNGGSCCPPSFFTPIFMFCGQIDFYRCLFYFWLLFRPVFVCLVTNRFPCGLLFT